MSAQLTEQVETRSLDTSLATLDSWSEEASTNRPEALAIGPFSVIDFGNVPTKAAEPPVPVTTSPQYIATPSSQGLGGSLPDYLQWSDLFDLEFETWLDAQPEGFGLQTREAEPIPPPIVPTWSHTTSSPASLMDDLDLKKDTPFLIKHFSDHVIPAIGALPFNKKSPFKIFNVASAVQAFADISFLETPIKHANAANLYGILACAAHHLANNPSGQGIDNAVYWSGLATRAGRKAKEHLQKSLQSEVQGSGKAKYKDQLMALICALTYAFMAGHQLDARCYLIDAERLLRLRGLAKRQISRRARMLHHMYTWCRIVGESTYTLHETAQVNAHIPPITSSRGSHVPNVGHNARLDDFLRIDQPDESYQDPEDQKDPQVGIQDIHLEDPRNHQDSMYLQIYGLPETWLSLLSQTARLANVMVMHKSNQAAEFQRSLEKRASRLEDMICSFAARPAPLSNEATVTLPSSLYMLRALNSALVIYFYRRIRNVNSLILQSHVDEVIDALRQFDTSLKQQNVLGPGTAWPAFIAGCEASFGARRDFMFKWMDTAFWKTGLQSYMTAQRIMSDVWTRKDQVASSPRSTRSGNPAQASANNWMDICREKGEWVILC